MKKYLLNSLLLTSVVLLHGCASVKLGVEPIYPAPSYFDFSVKIDSLMPTFRWKPYEAVQWDFDEGRNVSSNITYDLQITVIRPWLGEKIIYEHNNILTAHHKINIKLEPNTRHIWKVRVNYTTEEGEKQTTDWNGRFETILFQFLESKGYRFITPDL